MSGWLHCSEGNAPLIVSIPHAGTEIPEDIADGLVSPWLARFDADWHLQHLYAFAGAIGATIVRTDISRTVIDVNRDPSGVSLYPGQVTTGLCPLSTFDGVALYREGCAPDDAEIARRIDQYFRPYHRLLAEQVQRLRAAHPAVVLYEAHSIRSHVPLLFDGELPQFNIGTNSGRSCAEPLVRAVQSICRESGLSTVVDGRFKGGWITRNYGMPQDGVHAIQMELACRGYMDEPTEMTSANWPAPFDAGRAEPLRRELQKILAASIAFAETCR